MRLISILYCFSVASLTLAQPWKVQFINKKKGVVCHGTVVAENWVLTDSTCDLREHIRVRSEKKVSGMLAVKMNADEQAALVQVDFSEPPVPVILASREYPYEALGQTVTFEYTGRRKVQKFRRNELKDCGGLCVGERPTSRVKCRNKRGYPIQVENEVTPVVMGMIKDGGCFKSSSEIRITGVKDLVRWIEKEAGVKLPKSPDLCKL